MTPFLVSVRNIRTLIFPLQQFYFRDKMRKKQLSGLVFVQNNIKQHILPDSVQNINLNNYTAISYEWQVFFLFL